MAREQSISYSDAGDNVPIVYAVDDAWFEGNEDTPPTFGGLGGIHLQPNPLTLLIETLQRQQPTSSGSFRYLIFLAKTCQERGLALNLCNFEAFEKNWDLLNVNDTAILLDIRYANCPPDQLRRFLPSSATATIPSDSDSETLAMESLKNQYGIRLLHKVLEGRRSVADVFFVTGRPGELLSEVEAHTSEPSWWPVRAVPVVSKNDESLDRELECFATYFLQRNRVSPLVDILRTFARATTDIRISHPDNFEEVPRDIPFRNRYQEDIDALKALYHYEAGTYPISLTFVIFFLSTSGFQFHSNAPDERILLPRSPYGVVWLAQIWDMLRWLLKHAEGFRVAIFEISKSSVFLKIPLNPKYSSIFIEKMESGNGMAVSAFRSSRELTFRNRILDNIKIDERAKIEQAAANQPNNKLNYTATVSQNKIIFHWNLPL